MCKADHFSISMCVTMSHQCSIDTFNVRSTSSMSGPWDICPDINSRPMGHLRWVYNGSRMEHRSLSDEWWWGIYRESLSHLQHPLDLPHAHPQSGLKHSRENYGCHLQLTIQQTATPCGSLCNVSFDTTHQHKVPYSSLNCLATTNPRLMVHCSGLN